MAERVITVDQADRWLQQQQQGGSGITLVRDAPPRPTPEGLVGHLQDEFSQGIGGVQSGLATALNPESTMLQQAGGIGNMVVGGLQTVNAPVTAAAKTAGENVQDFAMGTLGMGPTSSALLATGADVGVQALGGPAAGRVLRETGRLMARVTPGFFGPSRSVRRGLLAEEAQSIPSLVKPSGVDTDQIYKALDQVAQRIPTPQLRQIATDLEKFEKRLDSLSGTSLQSKPIESLTSNIIPKSEFNEILSGGTPFNVLRTHLKRLNDKIRAFPPDQRDELYGAYMQLKRGIYEDMQNTRVTFRQQGITKDALDELNRADKAYRQDMAGEDLANMVAKATKFEDKASLAFDPNRVLTEIRRDQFFKDSVPPETLKDITDTLAHMSQKMPSRPGGSLNRAAAASVLAGGAAGVATLSGAGPAFTAPQFAGGMGGVAAASMAADVLIGAAMGTKTGRAMLRTLFKNDRLVTPEKMAALSMAVRGASGFRSGPEPQTVEVPAGPTEPPAPTQLQPPTR